MSEENTTATEQAIGSDLLAEMTKDYTPEMLATLDSDTRSEIEAAKAKATPENAEKEPEEKKPEEIKPAEPEVKPAVEETKPEENETQPGSSEPPPEDMKKVLSDALVRANARYSSLKGKYDSEGRRKDARIAELEAQLKAAQSASTAPVEPKENGDGDDFDDLFNDNKEKPQTPAAAQEQSKTETQQNTLPPDVAARLEALENYQLTADLDQRLRRNVGISIADFDAQPLCREAMNELTDDHGVTAERAIEEAKARRDNHTVTEIVKQVVNYMQNNGQWRDDTGNFPTAAEWKAKTSAPANSATSAVSAANTARPGNAPAAVVPHASGPAVAAAPVPRTKEVITKELDTLIDRMSHGDFRAANKVEKLQKELLEATR